MTNLNVRHELSRPETDPAPNIGEPTALLEFDFRKAWSTRDFDLAYQPQVNLRTKCVTGFEVLLRWHHSVHGNVSPAIFIPLAERVGLIGEIGRWVLEQACLEAMAWPEAISVAVNVSAIQLKDDNLPAIVAAALQESGLPPSRLELEVTETAVVPADSSSLTVLHAIRNAGVRIVMDDFDVGYSGLGYLLNFPFDKIKIDRRFVRKLAEEQDRHEAARAIIRAIISLCRDLDIRFLAEGVETEAQLAILVGSDCTEVQGYLFGRPLPPDNVLFTLRNMPDLLTHLQMGNRALLGGLHRSISEEIPFFQIAESARDIIIVTTADLSPPGPRILYVNPAFTRLTGYSAVEAIGLTPRILQGPGTSRTALDAIAAGLQSGQPVHEKVLNFAKSGALYWLDLHIVPLRDVSGAITHFAAIERDVTMDKRRLDELEYLADRDTLTGISNRRAFLRAADSEMEIAGAHSPFSVSAKGPCLALIDVDQFKNVNDGLGHAVGDAVLCGLADCLAENVRRVDILGRIGGEEFAVCMPAVALQDAEALAERLRSAIAAAQFETPSGPVNVTASIGVSCFSPGDGVVTLMQRADAAMYAAKSAGRNRVRVQTLNSSVG